MFALPAGPGIYRRLWCLTWLLFFPYMAVAEYGDIILNGKAEAMRAAQVNDVVFPHWFHRIRYRCDVCHEDIFIMKSGANDINMFRISEKGEQCGVCHNGIIAWEPLECDRCHSLEPGWKGGPIQHTYRGEKPPEKTLKERALDIRIGSPVKPYSKVIELASGWHPAALSESGLPLDKYGLVDWAAAVREGKIEPLWDPGMKQRDTKREERETRILFRTRSEFVADVLFPHEIHVYWMQCKMCHETEGGPIFSESVGKAEIDMAGIREGKWCGRCHGKVAFPISDCNRCHNHPKGAFIARDVLVRESGKGENSNGEWH